MAALTVQGSTTQVLAPQVYARARAGDLDGAGTLLAGQVTNLKLTCDINSRAQTHHQHWQTMATYLLYGSKLSPSEAKKLLEKLLTLQFEARESDYQGGEYFRAGNRDAENFELKKNLDPFDGDPLEMKSPEFSTLLYINATSRSAALKEIMEQASAGFALLRDENF